MGDKRVGRRVDRGKAVRIKGRKWSSVNSEALYGAQNICLI